MQSSLAAAEDLENCLRYHQLQGKVFKENHASCGEQAKACKAPVNLIQGEKTNSSDLKESTGYNYKISVISDCIICTIFCVDEKVSKALLSALTRFKFNYEYIFTT